MVTTKTTMYINTQDDFVHTRHLHIHIYRIIHGMLLLPRSMPVTPGCNDDLNIDLAHSSGRIMWILPWRIRR